MDNKNNNIETYDETGTTVGATDSNLHLGENQIPIIYKGESRVTAIYKGETLIYSV